MEQKSAFDSFELDINQDIKEYLNETSKWSHFLSILGFLGIGLMAIGGVGFSFYTGLNNFEGNTAYGLGYSAGIGLVYILLALVYFFPVLYLFKFSKHMKTALKLKNNKNLKSAFLNLKSHYKFMGIFTIVIISLYLLILVGVMTGAALF
ncbi:DUF5362 family protein [Tamlana sp. 2201CG12-4]|uniref:DUF5362 family protein n=1 Tax=Tamlana sp. 2201CG12-4 TaxID=3112582 RepID=UPI002DB66A3F|nr:DUF5362 family protein [Tamlana sp. 2201CG12-4]MEC3908586.1 DUF5362 family protein [Tamlana sp. 2201CG12-4]